MLQHQSSADRDNVVQLDQPPLNSGKTHWQTTALTLCSTQASGQRSRELSLYSTSSSWQLRSRLQIRRFARKPFSIVMVLPVGVATWATNVWKMRNETFLILLDYEYGFWMALAGRSMVGTTSRSSPIRVGHSSYPTMIWHTLSWMHKLAWPSALSLWAWAAQEHLSASRYHCF